MPAFDPPHAKLAGGLQCKRLVFRKWTTVDGPLAWSLWGDPAVTALIGGPFSSEQVAARLRREIECCASSGVQYWPVFERSSGEFVGCCGLRPYRLPERVFELGFHIRQQHAGKGFATEAAQAVIRHAFEELDVSALFAGHHPNNRASANVLRKLAFRYTHHEPYPPTGLEHPSYLLLRS